MSNHSIIAGRMHNTTAQGVLSLRFIRRLACLFGLILSDMLTFVVAQKLFCQDAIVPQILIYQGILPFGGTVDLFYLLGAAFVLVRYVCGDYTRRQLFWDEARQTTIGLAVAGAPSILLLLFVPAGYSAEAVLGSWVFVIMAVPAFRQLTRYLMSLAGVWQIPTALIGDSDHFKESLDAFGSSLSLGFKVSVLITSTRPKDEFWRPQGITWYSLQDPGNIVQRLVEAGCMQAVVTTNYTFDEETNWIVQRLLAAAIKVTVIPPYGRLPLLGITSNYFFGRELLLLHVRNNLSRLPSRLVKRVFDIVGSMALLILLSPVFAVISILVRRDDGGKVFFVQRRAGLFGSEFLCIKFRTMHDNAENMLRNWKNENSLLYQEYVASNFKLRKDPRVTRIGWFLRRNSLDELPQLLNVLAGNMSLVGPRPLLAQEIGEYGNEIELYNQVRPGITGLWQISGRSNTTFADRVASDEWYIKNWSFWYDIVILIKTVGVLVRRHGAY